MIIGMIAIFAGFSAAALAAWGDSRFLMAAPVATLIGVALVHRSAGREIPESRARAQGFAAAVLMAEFVPMAFVMWLVAIDDASVGLSAALLLAYGALAVVYSAIAIWRAMGVLFGWI
jgi:hypothetical protein